MQVGLYEIRARYPDDESVNFVIAAVGPQAAGGHSFVRSQDAGITEAEKQAALKGQLAVADLEKKSDEIVFGSYDLRLTLQHRPARGGIARIVTCAGPAAKMIKVGRDGLGERIGFGGYDAAKRWISGIARDQGINLVNEGNDALALTLLDGGTIRLTKDGPWGRVAFTRRDGVTGRIAVTLPVKEVDFRFVGGKAEGNIDGMDLVHGLIYEVKTAGNLMHDGNLVDRNVPQEARKAAEKKTSEDEWAEKQVFKAAKERLVKLQRPGQETFKAQGYLGPATVPPITEAQRLKDIAFVFNDDKQVYAGWDKLTNAVASKIQKLNGDPELKALGYKFEVVYPR